MRANSGGKLRRIARLEALADRRFQSEQLDRGEREKIARDRSFIITTNVCLISRYGKPRIEESLLEAWKRSLKPLLRDFPGFASNGRANPFNFDAAAVIARDFRKYELPRLPGTDDNDKIYRILAAAPRWLLWHTYTDKSCARCDIKVPDVTKMQRFARGFWFPGILPPGPFELRVAPDDETKPTAAKGSERQASLPPRIKTTHDFIREVRIRFIRKILVGDFQEKLAEGLNNGSISVRPFRFPPPLKLEQTQLDPHACDPFDPDF
jgi:hypothetical protein